MGVAMLKYSYHCLDLLKIKINHGGIRAKSAENMFCKCLEISIVQVSKNWYLREKLNIFQGGFNC